MEGRRYQGGGRVLEEQSPFVDLFALKELGDGRFQYPSWDEGVGHVYGGQLVGQAIALAEVCAEGRRVHSLQGLFLAPGNEREPVTYQVECHRNGKRYSARRITAVQGSNLLADFFVSLHGGGDGADYQQPTSPLPARATATRPGDDARFPPLALSRWVEGLPVRLDNPLLLEPVPIDPGDASCQERYWVRVAHPLPATADLHRAVLGYISDNYVLAALLLPEGARLHAQQFRLASLSHSLWLHRPMVMTQWLLFTYKLLSLSATRGLIQGAMYTEQGALVATVMQEGMIRRR
jgi:acyl-CoA thioesterase II